MTPIRAPDVVRGDVPGLLCREMPIFVLRQTPEDDEAEPCDGERLRLAEQAVVTDHGNDAGWLVATGRTVDPCGPNWSQLHTADVAIDWSDRAAIYLCLAWLADRGHPGCLWMLPTTHGGKVAAHSGLTAWEVTAILVSRSVGRVARGLGPVRDMLGPSVAWTASKTMRSGRRVDLGHGGYKRTSVATMTATHTSDRRWFYGGGNVVTQGGERDWSAHPSADMAAWETHACDMADRAALADGCALLTPGGILLPD